jgi:AcrR family transcriptional regulator
MAVMTTVRSATTAPGDTSPPGRRVGSPSRGIGVHGPGDGGSSGPGRAPGRPRSARADEAIIAAVIALLTEGTSVEALSIEAVAARAGVGKATIYRRWSNKESLLVDAIGTLKGPLPELDFVDLRADLVTLLRPVSRGASAPAGTVLPCLISELRRNPSLRQCYQRVIEPRRELMREVLRRGMARGELRADLDIEAVMAMLVAPLIAQSMFDWNPRLDVESLPERLVDAAWPALRA